MLYRLILWLKVLTHTCYSKTLQLIGRLNYPFNIIPRTRYIHKMDVNEMINVLPNLKFSRRIDGEADEVFDSFGKIRVDAIEKHFTKSKIPNMSTNLMGGLFKYKHIKYQVKGRASENWDGISRIGLLKHLKFIESKNLKNICAVYFQVASFHNIKYPYTCSSDKEAQAIARNFKFAPNPISKGMFEDVPCLFNVSHVPVNLNYWHMQLSITVANAIANDTNTAVSRKASTYIIENLMPFGRRDIGNYDLIPEQFYIKNAKL